VSELQHPTMPPHPPRPHYSRLRILGTHHKTGSFLTQRIWGGLHTLVHPSLNLHSSQASANSAPWWPAAIYFFTHKRSMVLSFV
jgi:hypothetical protein